ncbi:MAG: beta-ketoacyl-ACP synthase III [Bacillota bacterium]|nr:beta-ketoacyl-ACP synthase III [Bacillota bacterium]
MGIHILGTGSSLPTRIVDNHELSTRLDTDNDWIVSRTGIRERRIATTETLTDLSVDAARNAMEMAGLTAADIDMVLCTTINGDHITPSLACMVAERLGIKAPAMDLNAACTGFIYALGTAEAFLSTGRFQKILIISAEMMSRHLDWNDRATCILFGDAAGAAIVEGGEALDYIHLTGSEGNRFIEIKSHPGCSPFQQTLGEKTYLYLDGQEVFRFAVSTVEKEVKRAMQELECTPSDIDYFLLHQANKRIIESARVKLKQPSEKFPTSVERYGNISSASIPVLLDEMVRDHKIERGQKLFLCSFGAGLTAGSAVLTW